MGILETWRARIWPRLVDPAEGVLTRDADGVLSWEAGGGGGGVTDHGALTGLSDNDHPQYVLASTVSAFAATVLDDADAAAVRTTLGLGTAATTASSAYEAAGDIATHAALTSVHGISAFGATLVDDADASAARTTLGLGTAATTSSGAYEPAGTVATHAAAGDPHPAYALESGLAAIASSGSASDLGTGTLPIARVADGDVTLAKLANLATDRLIGRVTAGTGVPEAITCTAAGRALLDDAAASDQRTTLGLVAIASSGSASDLSTGTVPVGRLPAATTSAIGAVELATDGENAANVVVQGNDARLANARTPTSHASSHATGGGDPITSLTLTGDLTMHTASTAILMGDGTTTGNVSIYHRKADANNLTSREWRVGASTVHWIEQFDSSENWNMLDNAAAIALQLQRTGGYVRCANGVRVGAAAGSLILTGTGTPEAAVTAPIGSVFLRTDGSTGTSVYLKESGGGNTGWVAVAAGGGGGGAATQLDANGTTLDVDAIANGQYLRRIGTTVVGATLAVVAESGDASDLSGLPGDPDVYLNGDGNWTSPGGLTQPQVMARSYG